MESTLYVIDTPIDHKHPLQSRDKIQKLPLVSTQQIFIFSGHYHIGYEVNIDQINQFAKPAASSCQIISAAYSIEVNGDKSFGYRIITIENNTVEQELVLFAPEVNTNQT